MTIEKIAVIGAGTMGHGIAQVAARAGYEVVLEDVSDGFVMYGLARVADNLKKGVARGKLTEEEMRETLARMRTTTHLESVATADLVIEAVVEELEVKQQLFAQLDQVCKPETILATNTASLSVTAIGSETARTDRVIGMHFFNPVHIMKLLEVVIAAETSQATLDAVLKVAERMGKEAITVKDTPGFATSRLGVALGLEAMRMLEQGVANVEDIDRAMVLGYNHPMGPLHLTDLVGLDVRLASAEYLYETLGSEVFCPPEILKRKVAQGKLGQKSGKGFYTWE